MPQPSTTTFYERIKVAPAFAAFDASESDQREMAKQMTRLSNGICYHGHAGIASAFAGLAHKKLKPGGVLALVLPLSIANGLSWKRCREMLAHDYADMTVLSIAANGHDMSFSSDTGMAECLVIARKLREGEAPDAKALFTSFGRRPQGFAHASSLSGRLLNGSEIRRLEDGPYGGTPLMVGEELGGESVAAPVGKEGDNWSAVRLTDYSLAQTAYALSRSQLWLPGSQTPMDVQMTILDNVAKLGFHHLDIIGQPSSGSPQGPFSKIAPTPTSTYPSLWNHDAKNETRMVCQPDSQLRVRQGMEDKAAAVWATASRAHLNLDFTFGSQALAVAFTERESIGGRVWPSVIFLDSRFDYAYSIWSNSTLGLLSHLWHSSRQQSSKAGMTIRSAESLPVLDFRTFDNEQLVMAEMIFDEFRNKELKPAYLADADPNRALLDRRVVCGLLGLDEGVYEEVRRLAAKWCVEPSVNGGKARPAGASAAI